MIKSSNFVNFYIAFINNYVVIFSIQSLVFSQKNKPTVYSEIMLNL